MVSVIATDSFGANSAPAIARINFLDVDNSTPVVDLNGPIASGLNFSTTFVEGSASAVPVRCFIHFTIHISCMYFFIDC